MPNVARPPPPLPLDVLAHIVALVVVPLPESPWGVEDPGARRERYDDAYFDNYMRLHELGELHGIKATENEAVFELLAGQRDLLAMSAVCKQWRAATVDLARSTFVVANTHSFKTLPTLFTGRRGKNAPPPLHRPKKLVLVDNGWRDARRGPLFAKLVEAAAATLEEVELRLTGNPFGVRAEDPLGEPLRKALAMVKGMKHFRIRADSSRSGVLMRYEQVLLLLEAWQALETFDLPEILIHPAREEEWEWPPGRSPFPLPSRLSTLSLDISYLDDLGSFTHLLIRYLDSDAVKHLRNLHLRGISASLSPRKGPALYRALTHAAPHLTNLTLADPHHYTTNRRLPTHTDWTPLLRHLTSLRSAHLDLAIFNHGILLSSTFTSLSRLCTRSLRHLILDAGRCTFKFSLETEVSEEEMLGFLQSVYEGKVELGTRKGLKTLLFNGKTGKIWSEEGRRKMHELAGRARIELTLE
ncbi:hypothetical protein JCM8097_002673 [Rhodosporidiobolus ruineniae]